MVIISVTESNNQSSNNSNWNINNCTYHRCYSSCSNNYMFIQFVRNAVIWSATFLLNGFHINIWWFNACLCYHSWITFHERSYVISILNPSSTNKETQIKEKNSFMMNYFESEYRCVSRCIDSFCINFVYSLVVKTCISSNCYQYGNFLWKIYNEFLLQHLLVKLLQLFDDDLSVAGVNPMIKGFCMEKERIVTHLHQDVCVLFVCF